ncbi:hypothetical protein MKX03_022659 [Papaver bracteatum]|nr:hypothetical protein MKX03_022659 [Papaver bracteatum]
MADIKTCYRGCMPMIKSIPHEVLTEILAKLDLISFCKFFHEAAQDDFILRHASLDELPVIQWTSKAEVAPFLKRCENAQNPEVLYRQGMTSRGEDVEECRKKSRRVIRQLWVNNQGRIITYLSYIDNIPNVKVDGWPSNYKDMWDCEICRCNREFSHFTEMVLGVN